MQVNWTATRGCPVSIALYYIHCRLTWLKRSSSSHPVAKPKPFDCGTAIQNEKPLAKTSKKRQCPKLKFSIDLGDP